MISLPLRLLRNLLVNLVLAVRNLAVVLRRRRVDWVRVDVRGRIPERPAPRRLFRLSGLQLHAGGSSIEQLRRLFRDIARDPRARGVVLRVRDLDVGWSRLDSLRGLIDELRASGKEVVALLLAPGNREFYLACAANRILLEPSGPLGLVGLSAQVTFLGGLLERIGVRAELLPIGAYKSAADPLLRREMSPEHRASLDGILDGLYARFVSAIARGRRQEDDAVRALIDGGPYAPDRALAAGLCDGVLYRDELPERLAPPGVERAAIVSSERYRRATVRWSWVPLRPRRIVAVVPLRGMIVGGEGASVPLSLTGADAVIRALRTARRSPRVAAVVLHVDSPGGSVVASDQIWREAVLVARRKPLIAAFGDVAASGGYYAACGAHAIVAQPGTLTGSIGVVGGKLNLEGLYAKLGIGKAILTRGKGASMLTEARGFTEAERARLVSDLHAVYDEFLWRVAAARAMTVELASSRGEGRIFTGEQALAAGLVDRLGGLDAALALAEERARRRPDERFDARDVLLGARRMPLLARLLAAAADQPLALMPMRVRIVTLAVALLAGCAARPARPDDAVRAYADALERGDSEAAWALLAPELRARYGHEGFAEAMRQSLADGRRLARELRAAAPRTREQARYAYGDGRELRLVREGGAWRIGTDPLDFYGQSSPREALRSFLQALERRRYDVLLRLAPERWRRAMTAEDLRRDFEGPRRAEVDALVATLKKSLNNPIEQIDDQAGMPYGDQDAQARFIREGGRWKLEDPD
ncbi:MAG: signal peptide peptidase SppA [Myxococcota bacterium]